MRSSYRGPDPLKRNSSSKWCNSQSKWKVSGFLDRIRACFIFLDSCKAASQRETELQDSADQCQAVLEDQVASLRKHDLCTTREDLKAKVATKEIWGLINYWPARISLSLYPFNRTKKKMLAISHQPLSSVGRNV